MAEAAKTLLAKLRFIEWLSTRHEDLSGLQMAVAIRLVSLFNPRRGVAWPSLDALAADLGVSRSSIIRAVKHVVDKEIIAKRKGGGRHRASEYAPRFDRVPERDVYAVNRAKNSVSMVTQFGGANTAPETVSPKVNTVSPDAGNSVSMVNHHPSYSSTELNTPAPFSTASSGDEAPEWIRYKGAKTTGAALALIEEDRQAGAIAPHQYRDLKAFLDVMADIHDARTGDAIGGRAKRMAEDVAAMIEDSNA